MHQPQTMQNKQKKASFRFSFCFIRVFCGSLIRAHLRPSAG